MGHKHRKPRVAWNFDDECSMLAFLEFRISHGEMDRIKNIEAITLHLRKKRSKRFTSSQIEDILNEIQNQTTQKRRRGTVFTDGLRALSSVPHEENVLRLKQELEDEFVMNMQSQERVTRSASRSLGSSQPQRKKHVSGLEIPESPSSSRALSTRASRFRLSATKSTSPLARKRHFPYQSSHTPSNRTLSPKHEEGDRETPIPPYPTVRITIPGNSDISTADDLHSPISHNEDVSLHQTKTPTTDAGLYKRATNNLSGSFSEVKVKRLEEEVKDLKERLSQAKKCQQHLDSQMHNINSSLETALRECQRRCAEYADDIRCLKYTLSEKNPADRKLLYQQERQIEALRHSLSERQQNAGFSRLSADEHHVPKQDDVENVMHSIHHETKRILLSYDDNFTARTPDLDHEEDLRSLFWRVLGTNPSSPVSSETLKAILGKNGLQAIICALFASALCEWVFATDFESTIARSSMLLNMYRQHISSIAANKLLFGSDYYLNHAIPARAKELASMLSDALAPLIPNTTEIPRHSTDRFHTWGEGIKESPRREKRFIDVFKRALRLKGDLLSSTGLFSLVLYHRGTCFDKSSMIAETKHGDSAVMLSHTEPIQACLLPAIYLRKLPRQDIVDYKLEIHSECPTGSDFCLVSKAVVVVD
ncbi:hypothetical protein TMatcc_002293 [Talaromyces marneffei ATCC 18224]|uniref:Uncharacterized protein n=1 Tax=Talaromyces marneffei PM1 TaxID=1077442 RepID=A0A093XMT5_TALMA